MNSVLQTANRFLLSVSADELLGICNALNEVCHGIHIENPEFETRLGVSHPFLINLLGQLQAGVKHPDKATDSLVGAWADGGSVQAICVTVFGDPADMSCDEAREFAKQLSEAIADADA